MKTRPAAVAGLFYPADPEPLRQQIQSWLAQAAGSGPAPKAIIVPHAGYVYSGEVAAQAYARLRAAHDRIRRVVLLGPNHRVPLSGLALPTVDAFETPLGVVPLAHEAVAQILKLPQVRAFDLPHQQEHSLEVQLPFLQTVLDDFQLVPLVVGETSAQQTRQVLDTLWDGDDTLIVVSSDLSHYHDYDTARTLDGETCRAIETLNSNAIDFDHACGRNPVIGLLDLARDKHLKVTTLDLRNSGDTAGSRDRVVGYGAWMFEQNHAQH